MEDGRHGLSVHRRLITCVRVFTLYSIYLYIQVLSVDGNCADPTVKTVVQLKSRTGLDGALSVRAVRSIIGIIQDRTGHSCVLYSCTVRPACTVYGVIV